MSEHVFKPGDTAVITANDARSATDLEHTRLPFAEGDRVEVVCGPDADGDYLVRPGDWYIAARFLAPADEPAPDAPDRWAVGDKAEITVDCPASAPLKRGDRITIEAVEWRRNGDPPWVYTVSGGWHVRREHIRRPCTHGADCLAHPDENRLHNHDDAPIGPMPAELAARVLDLARRVEKLETRLQGVIETHNLRDGS